MCSTFFPSTESTPLSIHSFRPVPSITQSYSSSISCQVIGQWGGCGAGEGRWSTSAWSTTHDSLTPPRGALLCSQNAMAMAQDGSIVFFGWKKKDLVLIMKHDVTSIEHHVFSTWLSRTLSFLLSFLSFLFFCYQLLILEPAGWVITLSNRDSPELLVVTPTTVVCTQ